MADITRRTALPLLAAGLIAPGVARAQYAVSTGDVPVRAHLAITENPFGPSPAARQAIVASVSRAAYYSHSEGVLVDRICSHERVNREQVAISNGSLDALSHLAVGLGRGGHIVAPRPTYATHLSYAARQGIATQWVPLTDDHRIDLDAMLAAITPATRLVYICNPNNPTGLMPDAADLRAFCIAASRKAPVLVDEAFVEITPDPARQSMASLVGAGHDVIVSRTFSKVYGLAGFRIGYVLARPDRAAFLRGLITTSRNQAGLAAAAVCLGDQRYLQGAITYLRDCRERIYRICRENGLNYLPSVGTFVYIDTGYPADDVRGLLAAHGVDVRLFDSPRHKNWMRVGTATPEELALFGKALPKVLQALR